MAPPPTFDDWVDYSFTLGYRDFRGVSELDQEAAWKRQGRYSVEDVALVGYLTRLFESPAFLADRYTDDQIGGGIWYIFGVASQDINSIYSEKVPLEDRARCVRAVATLYTDLFDRVCGLRGEDPDSNLSGQLEDAVYMIWDMGGIEGALHANLNDPLSLAAFQVLDAALMKCITSGCRSSALHALGHLIGFHAPIAPSTVRAKDMIDAFLAKRRPPDWLREYAMQAREGAVQ